METVVTTLKSHNKTLRNKAQTRKIHNDSIIARMEKLLEKQSNRNRTERQQEMKELEDRRLQEMKELEDRRQQDKAAVKTLTTKVLSLEAQVALLRASTMRTR